MIITERAKKTLKLDIKTRATSLTCFSEQERAMTAGISQKKVMDQIGLTERKTECVSNINGCIQETTDIAAYGQTSTHTCHHDGGVMEGIAYCCVAVIGH